MPVDSAGGTVNSPEAMASAARPLSLWRQRDLLLLNAAHAAAFFNLAVFVLLSRYLEAQGVPRAEIGWAMGMPGVVGLVVMPLVGHLVDRHGRRIFAVVGALIFAAASAGFLLLGPFGPEYLLLRAAQGLGFALYLPAAATMVVDVAPDGRRAQALSLFGAFTLVATALGPFLGEAVASAWGLPVVLAASGGFSVLAAVLLLGVRAERPAVARGGGAGLRHLLRYRRLWGPLASSALAAVGFGVCLHFLAAYTKAAGLPYVSPYFVAFTLTAVLSRLFLGDLADRVGRRRVILPALAIYAVSLFPLILLEEVGTAALIIAGLGSGAAHGLHYPALNALVVDLVDETDRGRVTGLYNTSFNLGVTGAAVLLGPVAGAWGYPIILAAGTVALVLALAVSWSFPRTSA